MHHEFPGLCLSNNRRLKSCEGCRLSNKKCTRTEPTCGRCASKGIACVYSKNSTRSKIYRELKERKKLAGMGIVPTAPVLAGHAAFQPQVHPAYYPPPHQGQPYPHPSYAYPPAVGSHALPQSRHLLSQSVVPPSYQQQQQQQQVFADPAYYSPRRIQPHYGAPPAHYDTPANRVYAPIYPPPSQQGAPAFDQERYAAAAEYPDHLTQFPQQQQQHSPRWGYAPVPPPAARPMDAPMNPYQVAPQSYPPPSQPYAPTKEEGMLPLSMRQQPLDYPALPPQRPVPVAAAPAREQVQVFQQPQRYAPFSPVSPANKTWTEPSPVSTSHSPSSLSREYVQCTRSESMAISALVD
ncbi:hypothetical protein HDU98_005096 [Podochytrium sp. JEL0797]|nr:hypothetical protein HDU98_005096 [Podochytrium sp. JEL0797]